MKARPAFISALLTALAFGALVLGARAQEGPIEKGDYVILTKEEAQKIIAYIEQNTARIADLERQLKFCKSARDL